MSNMSSTMASARPRAGDLSAVMEYGEQVLPRGLMGQLAHSLEGSRQPVWIASASFGEIHPNPAAVAWMRRYPGLQQRHLLEALTPVSDRELPQQVNVRLGSVRLSFLVLRVDTGAAGNDLAAYMLIA